MCVLTYLDKDQGKWPIYNSNWLSFPSCVYGKGLKKVKRRWWGKGIGIGKGIRRKESEEEKRYGETEDEEKERER